MLIHQAIYGSDQGGHTLLRATASGAPFAELAWRTDLPGTAPPGILWEPYLSGFAYENYYVLARTFPDRAVARGGMVLSHALFLPIADASHIADLRGVTALLIREPVRPPSLVPLTFSPAGNSAPAASHLSQLGSLVEALMDQGRAPVVWIGQEGFEDAVVELWSGLWPGMRRTFSFRLSFGPQDCADSSPSLVSTPAPLESRWVGYRLVHPARMQPARTEASCLLLGLTEGQDLRNFIEELSAQVDRLTDLPLLEECRRYVVKLDPTVDELLAAVRLLALLSPRSGDGVAIKGAVIERLENAVPMARGSAILSMRNLDVRAFPLGERIWDAVTLWAAGYVVPHAGSDEDTAKVFAAAIPDSTAAAPWKSRVWEGFDRNAANTDPSARGAFAAAVWMWWMLKPVLVSTLIARLPDDLAIEAQLTDACPPSLNHAVADLVLDGAVGRGWYRLHAAAAGAAYDLESALARQLAVDRDTASAAGLQVLLRRVPAREIVSMTLRRPDPRLVELASQACSKDTELLRDFDTQRPVWRAIWASAMVLNADAWRGPAEPQVVVNRLVELTVQGETIEPELWIKLAQTPLGDLSECSQRRELWPTLPAEAARALLSSTADGWLDRFLADANFDPDIEPELRREILIESKLQPFLRQLVPARLSAGVRLFRRFHELSESRFQIWLTEIIERNYILDGVPASDAALLGRIIADRNWQRAAAQLVTAVTWRHRQDLRVALSQCQSLLTLWDRIKLSLLGDLDAPILTSDEVWKLFEKTAGDLYPKGPDHNELWSRAGGANSAIRHNLTGQAGWHEAVRLVRHGGGGKITPSKLLDVMCQDFPGNDQLRWLADQDEFHMTAPWQPYSGRNKR